jgi:hypothetical protein
MTIDNNEHTVMAKSHMALVQVNNKDMKQRNNNLQK